MSNALAPRLTGNQIVQAEQEALEKSYETCLSDSLALKVDKLQDSGINVADINKLKGAGIMTVKACVQVTKKELCNIKGLSEAKVDKIVDAAMQLNGSNGFSTASAYLEKREQIIKITTGSTQFDLLLRGGFESNSITELFGENRTGKTQVCHTLCVTAQLPHNMNGGNGKVCYIDTEGTFRPEKIARIAERFDVDTATVLDNIMYARAFTHEHMQHLLASAAAAMSESPFSLLIIDSIMALFRVDFSGRGELSERQQVLGKFLSQVAKMADQFNICVVMTNHVMSDPGGGLTIGIPQPKPIGGHVLGHASTTRLYFRKSRGDLRIAKIYDSPNLPEAEAIFQITDEGINDNAD